MKLTLLSKEHLSQLIEFEFANRAWFESFIESRDDSFYHPEAIERHLLECLQTYQNGTYYPVVIIQDNQIIGRINLKNICMKSRQAEVGYRVAKCYAGQGIVSQALKKLIQISRDEINLDSLTAFVLENNPASAKVLEKSGFIQVKKMDDFVTFSNRALSAVKYKLNLS